MVPQPSTRSCSRTNGSSWPASYPRWSVPRACCACLLSRKPCHGERCAEADAPQAHAAASLPLPVSTHAHACARALGAGADFRAPHVQELVPHQHGAPGALHSHRVIYCVGCLCALRGSARCTSFLCASVDCVMSHTWRHVNVYRSVCTCVVHHSGRERGRRREAEGVRQREGEQAGADANAEAGAEAL